MSIFEILNIRVMKSPNDEVLIRWPHSGMGAMHARMEKVKRMIASLLHLPSGLQAKHNVAWSVIMCFFFISFSCRAQFDLGGQMLQRAEYRNGFGRLLEDDQKSVFWIGQRARIHAGYQHEQVTFFVSAQDIRTWGSTPQAKESDNFLSVHEAYVGLKWADHWHLKIGRQELNYDNVRFLGNLDWALQARAHDFALVKYERDQMKFHAGAGYNQDREILSRQPFTVTNQYKAAQFARYENTWNKFHMAALFWNNGAEQNNQGNMKTRYMQTWGFPMLRYVGEDITVAAFYYHQRGKDITNRPVRANNAALQVSYLRKVGTNEARKLQATAGFEFISGTSQQATDNVNRSYNPLYGTNHAHNGYMDFFYVGGRHVNSVGLHDYFLRIRYDLSAVFFLSLNSHRLVASKDVFEGAVNLNKGLGTEMDLTVGYVLNDVVSLQVGYSQLWDDAALRVLQGVNDPASLQNWSYAALLIRPNMKNRFVGLLF